MQSLVKCRCVFELWFGHSMGHVSWDVCAYVWPSSQQPSAWHRFRRSWAKVVTKLYMSITKGKKEIGFSTSTSEQETYKKTFIMICIVFNTVQACRPSPVKQASIQIISKARKGSNNTKAASAGASQCKGWCNQKNSTSRTSSVRSSHWGMPCNLVVVMCYKANLNVGCQC